MQDVAETQSRGVSVSGKQKLRKFWLSFMLNFLTNSVRWLSPRCEEILMSSKFTQLLSTVINRQGTWQSARPPGGHRIWYTVVSVLEYGTRHIARAGNRGGSYFSWAAGQNLLSNDPRSERVN